MGFNISGIAIDKNYESEFKNLQKEFGWTLEKQSEINFETASSNWKDEGICDVYFSEQGTLLFISMDMCADSWSLKADKTLTFALSETSMAFNISYCENGIEKRAIMEVEGNRMSDEGDKLEVESKSVDASEIIWNQLEVIMGKRFWDIDPSEKAIRYLFSKEKKPIQETAKVANVVKPKQAATNEVIGDKPISKEDLKNNYTDKQLIQAFDQIIKFSQDNQINIFIHPWAHKNYSRKYMNLFSIITEIESRPKLNSEIAKRLPQARFDMICRFDPEKVDSKTNNKMLAELNKIKLNHSNASANAVSKVNVNKKWWEFWK